MFQASEATQSGDQPVCHPLDMVLNFFKDEATSVETTTKLRNFLQEALSIHSLRFEQAMNPEAWWNSMVFYCWKIWFDFQLHLYHNSYLHASSFASHKVIKDLTKLASGEMTHLEVKIPLDLIKIVTPADGLPCVGDFLTCCVSFIFSGSRLHREPLDLNWSNKSIEKFDIVKGFTRLTLDYKQCICLFSV